MVVEAVAQITHEPVYIQELAVTVVAVFSVIVCEFILHIERLGHVQTVKPHLIGVDLFVPEIAGGSPGLAFQLAVYGIDGFAVLFFPGKLIEVEKSLSGIDIVQIVLQRVIGGDGTIFLHEIVDKTVCEFQISGILSDVVQLQNCLDHTSVNVIPRGLFSLLDLLDIPHRSLWAAFLQQLINITIQNFHNTYLILSIW